MVAEVPRRRRRVHQPTPPSVPSMDQSERAQSVQSLDTDLNETGVQQGDDLRGDMRPPLREMTDRERADARAAELFEHEADITDFVDKFPMPAGGPPDGWHYEWKRDSVYGQRNPSYAVALATSGWQAVPASRHPEFMPTGSGNIAIEREGLMLMEIPKAVAERRQQRANGLAREQVNVKNAQLSAVPSGQFERHNKGNSMVSVQREYAPIVIPGNPK